MGEPDTLPFAVHEEPHDIHIYEADLAQIEQDGVATFLLEEVLQIRQVFGANSSAEGERCRS
jgi:hypothetical protein